MSLDDYMKGYKEEPLTEDEVFSRILNSPDDDLYVELVKQCIDKKVDVNKPNKNGRTPLEIVANAFSRLDSSREDITNVVNLLIENGAKVTPTALYNATKCHNREAMYTMMKSASLSDFKMALDMASDDEFGRIYRDLKTHYIPVYKIVTALRNDIEITMPYINESKIEELEKDIRKGHLDEVLDMALSHGFIGTLHEIYETGYDNKFSFDNPYSLLFGEMKYPLITVIESTIPNNLRLESKLDTIKFLVEECALEIDIEDSLGKTPLRESIAFDVDITKYLLEQGATSGNTEALSYILSKQEYYDENLPDIVQTFIDSIDKNNEDYEYEMDELLNSMNEYGETPLSSICGTFIPSYREYLENKEDPSFVDNLSISKEDKDDLRKDISQAEKKAKYALEVVEILIENGANPRPFKEKPLINAISNGNIEIAKLLINDDEVNVDKMIEIAKDGNPENILEFLNEKTSKVSDNTIENEKKDDIGIDLS